MSVHFARGLGGVVLAAGLLAWPRIAWPQKALLASGDRVAVLGDGEVQLFAADGRLLTRLSAARPSGPGGASASGRLDQRHRQILELYDVPTELRDSPEAEDLIEDELTRAQRAPGGTRGAPVEGPAPTLAAADGSGGFWVALGGRLHRVGADGHAVGLGVLPAGLRAMAADDGGVLVLATRTALLALQAGGLTTVARLDRDPTHLSVDPAGRWLAWADAGGVQLLRGDGRAGLLAAPAVRDLQVCAGQLLVLTDNGLHVSSSQGPARRVSGPLPARALACAGSDAGGLWLAAGDGLLASTDEGRSFRSRGDAPVGSILTVALAGGRIWLLGPEGIHILPLEESTAPDRAGSPLQQPGHFAVPRRGWARLLPRLTLAASYQTDERRRDFRALALAELPLGGPEPALPAAVTRRLSLAEPLPPEQVPPQPPSTGYPPAGAAPYPTLSPYPPPDPDARCLPPTRAQAVSRAQAEAERARSLVARAGRAGWLPELRLRAEKRMGRSESLDVRGAAAMPGRDTFGLDVSNAMLYEVRAIWDLPRLVFSPEEGAAVQQALRMADMRREIESQVNRVYFERRRLLVHPAGSPPAEATGALLRVEELDAELDALSAGAFSRCRASGLPGPGP
jgi:hypothetical protein